VLAEENDVSDNRGNTSTEKHGSNITRRRILQSATGIIAAATIPSARAAASAPPSTQASPRASSKQDADITGRLARYMVEARSRNLPPNAAQEAKHRILDTLGAMVSGAHLKPGEMAIKYIRAQGGVPESSVLTTDIKTSAVNAAMANAMLAHADETDDVELVTKTHPGSSSVAAALAMAEREGSSGMDLLRAVTLGYDVCCRFLMALGPDLVRGTHRSAEGVGSTFSSVAAAASLARLDETGMRYALSYAAQQVSGLWSWTQDIEHVEKAFDFAGMGARNGVMAVTMVQAGLTGVRDVFDCEHNVLEALSTQPRPEEMVADLGTRFYVTQSAIKAYPVGYPIQAALDALLTLRRDNNLLPDNVEHIVVRLPADGAAIVDNSSMPDVNCQYVIAVALVDGAMSFANAHSYERMSDPKIRVVKERIELVADRKLMDPDAPRGGQVEVTLRNGKTVSHLTRHPPGTKENPLDTGGLNAKVRDLMAPVLGAQKTEAIIQRVNALEALDDIRKLQPFLAR
jgi:2-methylcitrate dehydratase PrpD